MNNKNLKKLSFLLILAVLIVGAISAASATDPVDVGNSDVKITDYDQANFTQDTANVASVDNDGSFEFKVVTKGQSSEYYDNDGVAVYVPDNTTVFSDELTDVLKIGEGIFSDDKGKNPINTVKFDITSTDFDIDQDEDDGVYTITGLTIIPTATTGGNLGDLKNNTIYYMNVTVPENAIASFILGDGTTLVSKVKKDTTFYLPFRYFAADGVKTGGNVTTTYNEDKEDWTVSATTIGIKPDVDEIDFVITKPGDDEFDAIEGTVSIDKGVVKITPETTYGEPGDEESIGSLPVGTYEVTFITPNKNSAVTYLIVNPINVTYTVEYSDNYVAYDLPAEINITVKNKNAVTNPEDEIIIYAVDQKTGFPYPITPLLSMGNGLYTGKMTCTPWDVDGPVTDDDGDYLTFNLPVANYIVFVNFDVENYNFEGYNFTYMVDSVETEIVADPNPLYIAKTKDGDGVGNIVVYVKSSSLDDDDEQLPVNEGVVSAVLRDASGVAIGIPLTPKDFEDEDGNTFWVITVPEGAVEEGYYVEINYADTPKYADTPGNNYKSSSETVELYVAKGTIMVVKGYNPGDVITFPYGEDDINVTVTIYEPKSDDPDTPSTVIIPINDTVYIVSIDDGDEEILGTATLVNGTATFNLKDLELDAGPYTLQVKYVDEDNVYCPATADIEVNVLPHEIYKLNVNNDEFTYNITSDGRIIFTVTSVNDTSTIVPYNGIITYQYVTNYAPGEEEDDPDVIEYSDLCNITAVNGIANVSLSSLEGLSVKNIFEIADYEGVHYRFYIGGNYVSNEVPVLIDIELLEGTISTDNVTAHNDSLITVFGSVTNTTDGIVTVYIFEGQISEKDVPYLDFDDATAKVVASVEDEVFIASFGALANGNYTVVSLYDPTSADIPAIITDGAVSYIFVEGSSPSPEPTPTNGTYATTLSIDPFIEVVGAGKDLTGRLVDENGNAVVGMHLELTLTRVSSGASRTYTTTTDYNGEFQFPINLAAGEYTAQAKFAGVTIPSTNITYLAADSGVNPFTVLPENGTAPNATNDTTVVITASDVTGVYGTTVTLDATFTVNNTNIIGLPNAIDITLTRLSNGASKTYSWFVTDFAGAIHMPIELGAGDYSAKIVFKTTNIPEALQTTLPPVIYGAEKEVKITITNP